MKFVVYFLAGALLAGGCARHKAAHPKIKSPATDAQQNKMILTPETLKVGKVLKVIEDARFVVINFPVGTMPPVGAVQDVYRGGLKVGVVKINGPQQFDNTVGDIVSGEIKAGDEVRSN